MKQPVERSPLPLAGSLVLLMAMAAAGVAQPPDEPLESPYATVSQVVGLKPIEIRYFSPGVKDRKIWGELVPYGQNWRAGANGKTIVVFSETVEIDGTTLPAGSYGFYIFPASADEWQLVLNSSTEGSANEFKKEEDVVRVTVKPEAAPFRERLRYSIDNFSDWPPYTAELVLHWEELKVTLPVTIVTAED